jgi:UDP-N-acetylglucosamine acyltransferase
VSIHASKYENGETIIGNNCYLMNFSHVSHDVRLGNKVVLINSVNIAGHVVVEDGVMLMANSASHQNCKIGRFSCLTPYSAIRQDLPPFCMFTGQPAHFSSLNLVALKRNGLSSDDINSLKHVTKLFFQDKLLLEDIKKEILIDSSGNNLYVQEFLSFIEKSSRGVSRRSMSYGKNLYY